MSLRKRVSPLSARARAPSLRDRGRVQDLLLAQHRAVRGPALPQERVRVRGGPPVHRHLRKPLRRQRQLRHRLVTRIKGDI